MKYLLVGGPAHGQQHYVDNVEHTIILKVPAPLSIKQLDPNENLAPKIRKMFGHSDGEPTHIAHNYRRETVRHGDLTTTIIFIWEGKQ